MSGVSQILIVADAREMNGTVVRHWHGYAGNFAELQLESRELEYGDYLLGNDIVIERKSSTDFMLSVMDNQLYGNIAKLKAEFERVIYIVEGDVFAPRFHSNPSALRDALAYMTAVEGVALIPSPDAPMSAEIIYRMAADTQRPDARNVAVRSARPKDLRSSQQYVIEGLPGISAERARQLLKSFGSVENVLRADDEALMAAGVSNDTVARIRKILAAPWSG